ncbi:hypothetical protein ACHAXS_010418 [Conticribra weissflogii]
MLFFSINFSYHFLSPGISYLPTFMVIFWFGIIKSIVPCGTISFLFRYTSSHEQRLTMHQQTATCGSEVVSVAMKALKFGLWAVVSLTSVSSFSPSPALPYLGSIRSTLKLGCSRNTKNSDTTRSEFVSECIRRSLAALTPIGILPQANAFDGGVGGLGKKRPETGVVFRDPDAVSSASSSSSDDVTNELLSPDGTPAFVTFSSPWVSSIVRFLGLSLRNFTVNKYLTSRHSYHFSA